MQNKAETKEWTLMFYMASDNPLVVNMVSQLKALKAAGFHHDVNVVAQFDPYAEGAPTHIFDVNLINKLTHEESNIGFVGDDAIVRSSIEDKLWRGEKNRTGKPIREALNEVMLRNHNLRYLAPFAPDMSVNGTNGNGNGSGNNPQSDALASAGHNGSSNGHGPENGRHREPGPYQSLLNFLNFCSSSYPAKHYMLFIIGHGVVVGNDIFLFDAHAEEQHSITLAQMGDALLKFKGSIGAESSFDLVSFNSCSVSSLEVAYELKGIADYLLASQGPTFVGSWPYREILMRIFREVEENRGNIRQLISDIFQYCFHNSTDYLLAGYSFQLTLCDLSRVSDLDKPMARLSTALIQALAPAGDPDKNDTASIMAILYSHWKSQSFFEEMYTDLYDFCFCIIEKCERIEMSGFDLTPHLAQIRDACIDVLKVLAKPDVKDFTPTRDCPGRLSDTATVISASEFVGPAYQYSRGLSVYFPWTRPSADSQIMQDYETYKFHKDFKRPAREISTDSWFDFLETYFTVTQRETKRDEIKLELQRQKERGGELPCETALLDESPEETLQEDIGNLIYNGEAPLGGFALAGKTDPFDRTGDDCNCASIKNYPRETRSRRERRRQAQGIPVSSAPLGPFARQAK